MKMKCPVCHDDAEMISDPKFGTACSICIEECYESEDDKAYNKKRRSKPTVTDDDDDDDGIERSDLTRDRSRGTL